MLNTPDCNTDKPASVKRYQARRGTGRSIGRYA
jgi:hypothetical protein